ncbi:hypothetical protein JOM56_011502 [Amanita muscaria]
MLMSGHSRSSTLDIHELVWPNRLISKMVSVTKNDKPTASTDFFKSAPAHQRLQDVPDVSGGGEMPNDPERNDGRRSIRSTSKDSFGVPRSTAFIANTQSSWHFDIVSIDDLDSSDTDKGSRSTPPSSFDFPPEPAGAGEDMPELEGPELIDLASGEEIIEFDNAGKTSKRRSVNGSEESSTLPYRHRNDTLSIGIREQQYESKRIQRQLTSGFDTRHSFALRLRW